jgi:hypothetical protein
MPADYDIYESRFPSFTGDGIPGSLLRLRRNRNPFIACPFGENRLRSTAW